MLFDSACTICILQGFKLRTTGVDWRIYKHPKHKITVVLVGTAEVLTRYELFVENSSENEIDLHVPMGLMPIDFNKMLVHHIKLYSREGRFEKFYDQETL